MDSDGPSTLLVAERPRVLVVDDDPAIRRVVQAILEDEGFAVHPAQDGRDALSVVSSFCPHVILLDMQMPVMDGWQFARAYRQRTITAPLVIMTSARDASGYAAEISADGYVSKPFAADDLLREVRRLGGGHTAAALAVAVEELLARRQQCLRALEWARRHTAAIESTPTDHLRERLLALDEELRRLLDQLEASTPPEDPER